MPRTVEGAERQRARTRKWNLEHPTARRVSAQRYYQGHKDAIMARQTRYSAARSAADPLFRITRCLRTRICAAVKRVGSAKSVKTATLIGCSVVGFKAYLEARFQKGMSWENYGEWHIDHIRPCASFDLMDPEQQAICFHYTNLQPLWAVDNLRKGAKVR